MTIRSLLWIGPARRFPTALSEDPRVDVAWEDRGPDRALTCDLVVLDSLAPDAHSWLAGRKPDDPPVIVWTPTSDTEAQWLARGAKKVLLSSSEPSDLVGQLFDVARPARTTRPAAALVALSPGMRAVTELAQRVATSSATVLVLGETGSGKEVIARAIHAASPRSRRPFVAINCAALPDSLLESELFGHTRGAFTGAERERRGAFEEAHTGTLFLDEVGETSGAFQAKLLRVLQDRAVRPLGSAHNRNVDVRIIAATHRELRHEVARGRFREDLFFRLHVVPIRIPPLRERPEDVIALAERFLSVHGAAEGKRGCTLSSSARRRLLAHRWPGNVRELENQIQRALLLVGAGDVVNEEHLCDPMEAAPPPELAGLAVDVDEPLRDTLARVEAWLLRSALDRNAGHRSETARRLGLTREGLYKKMKRFHVA